MQVRISVSGGQMDWLAAVGVSLRNTLRVVVRRVLVEGTVLISESVRDNLTPRSGFLGKSWLSTVTDTPGGADGSLASNIPYARIQNEGGTVTPKNGRYLAIPLGPAKTPAGVSKFKSPREIPGLVCIRSKMGNLLLVKMEPSTYTTGTAIKRGRITTIKTRSAFTPWFVLRESVTIPASHYLDKALEKMRESAQDIANAAIDEAVNRANEGSRA